MPVGPVPVRRCVRLRRGYAQDRRDAQQADEEQAYQWPHVRRRLARPMRPAPVPSSTAPPSRRYGSPPVAGSVGPMVPDDAVAEGEAPDDVPVDGEVAEPVDV